MGLGIARRYKRWRHGRGFGIHSPFAYDFITRTLRERLPYYAYDNIDALAVDGRNDKLPHRRLRLLYRIAVRFNPSVIGVFGNKNSDAERATLSDLRSDLVIKDAPDECLFAIINSDSDTLPKICPHAVYVFTDARRGDQEQKLWSQVSRGMRFDNCRGFVVIVTSPSLPRQSFEVRF